VGWAQEIDDGLVLNLAPLAGLLTLWKKAGQFSVALEEVGATGLAR